jgi:hypothetical protein
MSLAQSLPDNEISLVVEAQLAGSGVCFLFLLAVQGICTVQSWELGT